MLKITLKYKKNGGVGGRKKKKKLRVGWGEIIMSHFLSSCNFHSHQGQNDTRRFMYHQKIEPEHHVRNERVQAMNGITNGRPERSSRYTVVPKYVKSRLPILNVMHTRQEVLIPFFVGVFQWS